MKILFSGKDGGAESTVWGFWVIEVKRLFSLAFLVFENGSREAFHNHAFNSVSLVLKGCLEENNLDGSKVVYHASLRPIITQRNSFHKVVSVGQTWVITIRGPWTQTWREYLPLEDRFRTLTNGRREV